LDDWELKNIYDSELSSTIACTPTRASEIRRAHDSSWQTLDPDYVDQQKVTDREKTAFNSFNTSRTHLYSCVLPGELIYKCVKAIEFNELSPASIFPMKHLIVDEFQDLNACDQKFVELLCTDNVRLFVAGDDDQSIYSFRHADPAGIIQFDDTYLGAETYTLTDCFRCTPGILDPATRLIEHNHERLPKRLEALYATAEPPVKGLTEVWSFLSADAEARAIAKSCDELIKAGMAGQEDEIIILMARRKPAAVQLDPISRELANLGLPFSPPGDPQLANDMIVRAVFALLRVVRDCETDQPDYPAHRTLLGLLSGVGPKTAKDVADACVSNNQNFRDLFYLETTPKWLTARCKTAVDRVRAAVAQVCRWHGSDTLESRQEDISQVLSDHIFTGSGFGGRYQSSWGVLEESLPPDANLDELTDFLAADSEAEQELVRMQINERLGLDDGDTPAPKRIRILTMHGAKGLSGQVVFIPTAEQGVVPSFKALKATGLLIEQRRLFYVSQTRAKVACIISHSAVHRGAGAFAILQQNEVRLPRSQFLNEMACPSRNRSGGLTSREASAIVAQVSNL
jgi:DNA helicase II / ATP-dependent DNA helicase PcrA